MLIDLLHEPAVPARKNEIGEVVFLEAWQRLMKCEPPFTRGLNTTMLDCILSEHPLNAGQRAATVCASIITWLGTRCGMEFLAKGAALGNFISPRSDAFLAAWAIQNKRCQWVNSGIKTIEHCLATIIIPPYRHCSPDDYPTADDYETAECLMRWLGDKDGERFINYCEHEIKLREKDNDFPFKDKS